MKVGDGQPMTQEQRDLIALLKSCSYWPYLPEWSQDFLTSISSLAFLSEKQAAALESIYDQLHDEPSYIDEDWGDR